MPRRVTHSTRSRPHVALLVETSIAYGRGVLQGVAQYLRSHGPWSVFVDRRELGAELPDWLDHWHGDGIITRTADARLLKPGVPIVGLYDAAPDTLGVPTILNDNFAVGRLAAEHLLERGFEHIAFFGPPTLYWADMRLAGARQRLEAEGLELHVFPPPRRTEAWEAGQQRLGSFLGKLPRPLGVIAANDVHGLRALDACRRCGFAVPEEVAVIGADDDAELCDLSDPPLSSIAFNPERVGYEAAALLDRLMRHEPAPTQPLLCPPLGVIARQSTDMLAIRDPAVAQALHFIRRHAMRGITVADVMEAVTISRRTLEKRFLAATGRTIKSEIQRTRIDRARMLLSETKLPIARVAATVGFRRAAYFCHAFGQATGMTPTAFRRQTRRS